MNNNIAELGRAHQFKPGQGSTADRLEAEPHSARPTLARFLEDNRFPKPPRYLSGTAEYFSNIALDEKVPCKMRVTAAIEANTLALFSKNRVQCTLRMSMAYEDALDQYQRSFPRDVEDDE